MKSIIIFLLLASSCLAQYIPIDSVRRQDANGVPLLLGQTVTVRGVVTTQRELGVPLVYFQDPTGGLVAYDSAFGLGVNRGDSVQLTGVVTQFNGLTELQPVNTFNVLAMGRIVNPQVVNTNGIRVNGETYEGRLIRINNIIAVKNTSGVLVTQWTVSGSGTNYRIFDGTGDSCDIRIYASTNIANSTIPAYPFSVIAVNSQFDSSPPYTSGYQIIPRSLTDLISTGGGPLLSQITYNNILPTSVTVNWTTSVASDSKVRWVFTDSNYQPVVFGDSLYNPANVTNHSMVLNNLRSGRIYTFNVTSAAGGSTTSSNLYFITQSGSAGTMKVYFNKSVDTTLSSGENANGNSNIRDSLIRRINGALFSIDMALYSYDDFPQITNALISARTRGVVIRFVYDSRTNQAEVNNLIQAGIPIQKRNYQTGDIMHNKFIIFDYRDTSSVLDDWVWTGSTNISYDQVFTDAQNTIEIQDQSLAAVYTREFEEMWGTHTNQPDPIRAKFGPLKLDNVPHILNVNGSRVEAYFSPSDNTSTQIENLIAAQTDYSIYFCIYSFTRFNIENSMHSRFNAGKDVKGVFDQAQGNDPSSVYQEMKGIGGSSPWNPPADVWLDNQPGLLHSKYMIIDALWPNSNPAVETGSYNYSNAATFNNDENYLIVYNSRVANLYVQEWYKRYRLGGGVGVISVEQISNEVPAKFELLQNYPNPFNPSTTIEFGIANPGFVKIKIYDMLGREVIQLVNESLKQGSYKVSFNGANLSSGIYYYTLESEGIKIDSKKMILVK